MRRFNPRPRFYMFMIVALLAVLAVSFTVGALKLHEGDAVLADKKNERNALSAEISDLQDEIDFAQTDEFVERTARDELGLIMPGEIRYVGGN